MIYFAHQGLQAVIYHNESERRMSVTHSYILPRALTDVGSRLRLREFPELVILYDALQLDPYRYTFTVNGHKQIILSEHDLAKNHAVVLGEYEFRGNGLFFNVARHLVSSGSDSGAYGTETRSYRMNTLFVLEFTESGGTGHTWQLKLPPELLLVEHLYLPHCIETTEDNQRPSCVNTHRFLLQGTEPGQFCMDAQYSRAWAGYGEEGFSVLRTRQYIVTILKHPQ